MMILLIGWLSLSFTSAFDTPPPKVSANPPYVEFDFSTLPENGEGECSLTLTVFTEDKDLKYTSTMKGNVKKVPSGDICAFFAGDMKDNRFKAEVVGKTKLRVYGRIFNGELIPATKGMVESKDLKPEELPKVKNPEKKG